MICIVTEFTFVSFYLNVTTLRSGICYRKSVSLSSVTYVYLTNTRGLKLSALFLRYFVPYPSFDLRANYGDRPGGTPPSGALNARGYRIEQGCTTRGRGPAC